MSALEQGGPGLLATLIIASSLVQFALAARLSALRRIFTPTVAGTVVMLIPVGLAPLILGRLADVPEAASPAAAPVTASVTLLVIVVAALRGSGLWRLWGPTIGVVAGSVTGGLAFGIYDTASVREAGWIGLPPIAYPGLDLGFGPAFWTLLPAFVLVTVVGAMDTLGDGIAIQRVSWRASRAPSTSGLFRERCRRTVSATCSPVSQERFRTRRMPRAPRSWSSPAWRPGRSASASGSFSS